MSQETEIDDSDDRLVRTPPRRVRDAGSNRGGSAADGATILGTRARDEDEEEVASRRRLAARTVSIRLGDFGDEELDADHGFASRTNGSLLPADATIHMKRRYTGPEEHKGDIVLLIGKKGNAATHLALYTIPEESGGQIIKELETQNGGKRMQDRHRGMTWVGIDKANLVKPNKFGIHKRGWFANVGTCGSSRHVMQNAKNVAAEIVTSGAAIDFTLANIEMTDADLKSAVAMMNRHIGSGMKFKCNESHFSTD